jgi:Fe-S cluster biogenesis protein NfuA
MTTDFALFSTAHEGLDGSLGDIGRLALVVHGRDDAARATTEACGRPCDGCVASSMTLHEGVEAAVKDACPEITSILRVKGSVGAAAADVGAHVVVGTRVEVRAGR